MRNASRECRSLIEAGRDVTLCRRRSSSNIGAFPSSSTSVPWRTNPELWPENCSGGDSVAHLLLIEAAAGVAAAPEARRRSAMELTEIDLGDNREGAGAETGRCVAELPVRSRVSSNAGSLVEDEEAELGRSRRASRTSSLVSGLLTELYSVARVRHRDSVDSSTEASAGSDAFPGGRGSSAESRVLQELQRNSGQRHQRKYLAQKGKADRGCLQGFSSLNPVSSYHGECSPG